MTSPLPQLLRDTAHNLSAPVLGVAGLVLAVTGVGVGVSLLFTVVGVAVLAGTLVAARGLAALERARIAWLLDAEVSAPSYLTARAGDGWLRRTATPLRDAQSWLDLAWSLVAFVTGTVVFTVTVTWWAVAGGGLSYWWWQQWLPDGEDDGLAELIGLGEGRMAESLLMLVLGLVAALTLPFVVRGCAAADAGLASALLSRRPRSVVAGGPQASAA